MSGIDEQITVVGAGILGLWQALTLAQRGARVRLVEASADPFTETASRYAGAMLAPDCEAESAPEIVRQFGHDGLRLWRAVYPHLIEAGTLVVAAARDRSELNRFARLTSGHTMLDAAGVAEHEPDLGDRFAAGLLFANEAHMETGHAMSFLLDAARGAGAEVRLGEYAQLADIDGVIIDCRGMAAADDLETLRGVRGERVIVHAPDVTLSRPVRLLHPRHPLYVVPWPGHRFMIGATVIESDDDGPATVRSALELLGNAYALHTGFGEAQIIEFGAGLRPAFPDNVPRVFRANKGRIIRVNGAYRHGFLLAPVLAELVAAMLDDPAVRHPLLL
ncbi:MAG: FAD-dependent oxidoreductase [Hyphomicrobiaceae bacterium]|nr:FAD-dependent oxidoreductase [Hyphomicrobiaceae bacterium]MCC0008701.1 FAD-dependent oxidoreductase [Hyphomicrobiaceae bacterium]